MCTPDVFYSGGGSGTQSDERTAAYVELGRRLSAATTPRQAAGIIAKTADALLGWDACFLLLWEAQRKHFETVFCVDTINGKRSEMPPETADPGPYAARALSEGPQLILRAEPASFAPGSVPIGDESRPSVSIIYVPLKIEDKVLGIFSIQSYTARAYEESDLPVLVTLADFCGGALARIRAEGEVQQLNRELERRVRERTAQLEAVNKELEAFCYSISHDLRAPLRSIRGFSELLAEHCGSKIDAEGHDFLRRISASSEHMDHLIEDLLKLSRVGRHEMSIQEVDLSALAEEVAAELGRERERLDLQFTAFPGLRAKGDKRLLRIVLENLLRNAWKFTSKRTGAVVEFGCLAGAEQAFFVRDNGAGFDPVYGDKLFGVFQRLHSARDFPGTGVGLATVQRIVSRHGGRVWAEGSIGRGATFYFTIPARDER